VADLRPAKLEDARGIARAHVLSWQTAYRGLVPDGLLDGLSVERRAGLWTQILTDLDRRQQAVWVWDEAEIAGFICVGPSRDTGVDRAIVGELQAIYLAPPAWGRGIGHALHEAGIAWLRERGFVHATLWMVDGNARALAFYERHGWHLDGSAKQEVWDGTPMDEVRLRRTL
jgi:GNAT superfamily N-acetyltransferase